MEANDDGKLDSGDSGSGMNDTNGSNSNNGDSAANGTLGMASGASNEASSGSGGVSVGSPNENVCRDFMRNVCTRGKKCKYSHPETKEANPAATLLQDSIVFCHDYQNRNDCSRRQQCRFIHCRKEEEEEFKRSGFLPPHVRDQAITKGVAPDLPALYGARPICKDYLKGDCRRGRSCRFRHLSPRQYDMEMSTSYSNDYNGYGYDGYDMPPMKRRRGDYDPCGPMGYGDGGRPSHSLADMDMMQQENMLLKSRVEELKKQVQELTTTNNFLLEQNAQLRCSVKGPQPGPIPIPAGGPQPPVSMQPPISMEMPMATTSISMAPQHDSARMVSYPGRL